MNFNQEPGFYDAKTDELIIGYKEAFDEGYINICDTKTEKEVDLYDNSKIQKPFYVIFPEDKKRIEDNYFVHNEYLIGVCGKGIEFLFNRFVDCPNLEDVYFPNAIGLTYGLFQDNEKLEKKYTNESGLFLVNDALLISAKNYKGEKLIIPSNVKAISTYAFEKNNCIEEIYYPTQMHTCIIANSPAKKVVLPIDCNCLVIIPNILFNDCDIVYKGTSSQFDELLKKKTVVVEEEQITLEPYTIEELKDMNYPLQTVEYILNKKLILDEILELNYSLRDANDYFKEIER